MMGHNTLKSTRLQAGIVIWIAASVFLGTHVMNADQWIGLTQWIFGVYAASEVGAKGASAYKDKA